ncbi:hypothetical protein BWQ96_07976 [Gracilariopsis chorda]|uniref:Uncharacterized protein n=1 Tax=Gracilariopsis chorda TaxID=448386 RepID=A0A2V3IJK0_9FLOR|nr:hypothetical protein BWQ96_07976 [Gracilariopsis chorda]|eukprot:PXF42257.1 hypothetical protein BWQ96_07976 [Gracilariopsis chorda]
MQPEAEPSSNPPASSQESAPPAFTAAPRPRYTTPSIDALTLPDTFDDFIRLGDAAPEPPPPFWSNLVRAATDTIETGLQRGTGVLNAANEVLPSLSAVFSDRTARSVNDDSTSQSATRFAPRFVQLRLLRAAPAAMLLVPSRAAVISDVVIAHLNSTRPNLFPLDIAPDEPPTTSSAASVTSPSSASPTLRSHGRPPTRVTAAAYMPRAARFFLGVSTNHVYSMSSDMGDRRQSRVLRSVPTSIAVSPDERLLYVGTSDGYMHIMEPGLNLRVTFLPPEIVSASLGSAFRHAPVSHVAAVQSGALVCYEEGAVCSINTNGDLLNSPFIAHARRTSSALSFFGVLVLTIGDASDPSMSLFEISTGRCLFRRMLAYTPTCLKRVSRSSNVTVIKGEVCPSEVTFIVGGDEAHVEVYKVAVLSPMKVEVNRVYTVNERIRGRDRHVVDMHYLPDDAVMLALLACGEVRRWHFTKSQANALSLIEEHSPTQPTFTEQNVVEATEQDFGLPDYGRHTSTNVLKAQTVLAAILDEEVVPEQIKDNLVTEFTKEQSSMVAKLVSSDTELRRARRRILARFSTGISADNELGSLTERTLARASKRMAAMEMEMVTRQHSATLRDIQRETVIKLKLMLKNVFSAPAIARSESQGLQQAKRDVEEINPNDGQIGWS